MPYFGKFTINGYTSLGKIYW